MGCKQGCLTFWLICLLGEAPKNKAAEKELNRRPYFVHIKAEDMIGWKTETVHGKETLAQIRFREIATVADGEFGEKNARTHSRNVAR